MLDPKVPFQARILARIAVQEADLQAAAMQELLKLIPMESAANAEIKVHDIVMIEVDERAEVLVNARPEKIAGQLQNRIQLLGNATDKEEMTYKIGATVVDVLPNGTLVLEGRKSVEANRGSLDYRLTGRVPMSAVGPDRIVSSHDIVELDIIRSQKGKIKVLSGVEDLVLLILSFFTPSSE